MQGLQKATDKATLVKGINEVLAYCDEVYTGTSTATTDFNQLRHGLPGRKRTRLAAVRCSS